MCESGHCCTDPHSVHKMFVSSCAPKYCVFKSPKSFCINKFTRGRNKFGQILKHFQLKSGDLTKNGVSKDSSL